MSNGGEWDIHALASPKQENIKGCNFGCTPPHVTSPTSQPSVECAEKSELFVYVQIGLLGKVAFKKLEC